VNTETREYKPQGVRTPFAAAVDISHSSHGGDYPPYQPTEAFGHSVDAQSVVLLQFR
jgi:hypothetical protein